MVALTCYLIRSHHRRPSREAPPLRALLAEVVRAFRRRFPSLKQIQFTSRRANKFLFDTRQPQKIDADSLTQIFCHRQADLGESPAYVSDAGIAQSHIDKRGEIIQV